jgi:pilus assembly protein TadC
VAAALACGICLGGVTGWIVGLLVGVACDRFMARLEPASVRLRRERLTNDLPIAVDLLAACLRGGTSWSTAVESVAAALGGPLGEELQAVAAQIRLGADPAEAWLTLTRDPTLDSLARTVARASETGASLAPVLARLAKDHRRAARAAALSRARAAGVRAVAPLGLCFLPAFVVLGIVPAIAGIATSLRIP